MPTQKKNANSKAELAHSIGSGYPLKSCSSAEPFSVLPDFVKVDRNTNSDTV